jgi:prepilin-type N-terminal cleavage/methylation domain-containing protein
MRKTSQGTSLIEVLIVIAILSLLMGILYLTGSPARARARTAVCMSNLRQLGQAMALYRLDYGGTDSPAWPDRMGFQSTPFALTETRRPNGQVYLNGAERLLICPSRPLNDAAGIPERRCDYNYQVWMPGSTPRLPPFPEVIADRGEDYPIMADIYHDFRRKDRAYSDRVLLILRLDGRVSMTQVDEEVPGWKW